MDKKAIFTNEVYQNTMKETDTEFNTQEHQTYFEFKVADNNFLVGLNQILECMLVAEKAEQIPKLGNSFWQQMNERYGIDWYNYSINFDKEN